MTTVQPAIPVHAMAIPSKEPLARPRAESTPGERQTEGQQAAEAVGASAQQATQQASHYAQQLSDFAKQQTQQMTRTLQEGHLAEKAQAQVQTAQRSFRESVREGMAFAKRHPMFTASALGWTFVAGLILSSLGFTLFGIIPWLFGTSGRTYGWSRGSPQYEAHRALDVILRHGEAGMGTYERMGDLIHGMAEPMRRRPSHDEGNIERAYHYLSDKLSPPKQSGGILGSLTPSFLGGGQEPSFRDYIPGMGKGHEYFGGMGRGEERSFKDYIPGMRGGDYYSREPSESKGALSRLMDNVKYYTGISDIAKLEKAETQLREAIRARRQQEL